MSFEEMVVVLVGSIAAFGLLGYVSAKIFGLIGAWINRNKGGITEEEFNRLAKAFMQYKKDTEQRLQNLEAIISEQDSGSSSDTKNSTKQIDAPKQDIEIKDQNSEKGKSQTGNSNDLRNMLQE